MKTVAIIAEYNPFHNGHEYQIKKIREEFGADTRIVAIMSGNYVQRGEVAFVDKFTRAECAVRCGVNLVLELPFPFSSSSAEFFARAGVKIAAAIPSIDYLSFGSECGDVERLSATAKNMLDPRFVSALKNSVGGKNAPTVKSLFSIYNSIFGEELDESFFTSNNILAIEYIKAIYDLNLKIEPHTVKRLGADYNEENIIENSLQSASAIRAAIYSKDETALEYMPKNAKDVLLSEYGNYPADIERIAPAIISSFRINTPNAKIHDAEGGLYNRLKRESFKVDKIQNLISQADTKKYTSARIRRAVLNSFFGVTSSIVRSLPQYTQVLALDSVGGAILKEAKKATQLSILTKPSRTSNLTDTALLQKELSDRADSIYQLTLPSFRDGNASITKSPFIMK